MKSNFPHLTFTFTESHSLKLYKGAANELQN